VVTRVLCPTDFSPASDAALAAAEAVARSFGARIELVHVWAPPISVALDAALVPTPEQIVKYTEAMERALAQRAAGIAVERERVDTHLIQGTAWREIVDFATRRGCDLVVMSSHGHTGLTHLLMGSTTERVVRHAQVPVLVVPGAR
jgi:nucleotide-binding universal stress UspA family protein